MIAISTYMEPPVNPVVEQPQLQETEEPEEYEHESFAEILSGLMQKPEINLNPENEIAALPDDIGVLFGEAPETGEDLFLSGNIIEDKQIPDDLLSVLLNNEYLFSQPVDKDKVGNEDDFLPEVSGLINENDLSGFEFGEGFFTAESAKTGIRQIAASNIAAGAGNDADNGDKFSLKDRRVSASENIENLIAKDGENEKTAYLQNKTENGNNGRQDEGRGRSRRGVTFEVRDMRTENSNGLNNTQARSFSAVETSAGRSDGGALREVTLELKLPYQNEGSMGQSTAQTTWEVKAESALENMLARELHQNFNGDIVRHASMALRDGGEGTIRIALKPESLGNVKIHLEMTENKITGRIVVESAEALNAFRKEISALEQAFRDSGFANADLNLSLTADGQSADGREQEADSFTPRMAALRYEGEQDILRKVDVYIEQKSGSINMLA